MLVDFWRLPQVAALAATWVNDVRDGRSLLLLAPRYQGTAVVSAELRHLLSDAGFYVRGADVSSWPEAGDLLQLLQRELGCESAPGGTAEGLDWLERCSDTPDVLVVTGLERGEGDLRRRWLGGLDRWALMSKEAADSEKTLPPVVVVAPVAWAAGGLPRNQTHLVTRGLWGRPTALDVQMLCRLTQDERAMSVAQRWREHVLPSLVGDDLGLIPALWDEVLNGMGSLLSALNRYAEDMEWDETVLVQAQEQVAMQAAASAADGGQLAPSRLATLWAEGMLASTPEYGVEMHAAASVLAGNEEAVRHRVWRGQVALLLPFLDALRVTVCEALTLRHGSDWPLHLSPPKVLEEELALRESPLACEYGRLDYLLRNDFTLRTQRERYLGLVAEARRMRNMLAHYQPVRFAEYEWLSREARRIGATHAL